MRRSSSGATFAEPATSLVFWRTADSRLVTAAEVGKGGWHRDPAEVGQAVEEAQLVSNRDGYAVLAWSSSTEGVQVTSR